jgi:hypothetical protein
MMLTIIPEYENSDIIAYTDKNANIPNSSHKSDFGILQLHFLHLPLLIRKETIGIWSINPIRSLQVAQ